jgi:hypothetical protein
LQYLCCRLAAMGVGGEVVFLLHPVTTLLDTPLKFCKTCLSL